MNVIQATLLKWAKLTLEEFSSPPYNHPEFTEQIPSLDKFIKILEMNTIRVKVCGELQLNNIDEGLRILEDAGYYCDLRAHWKTFIKDRKRKGRKKKGIYSICSGILGCSS